MPVIWKWVHIFNPPRKYGYSFTRGIYSYSLFLYFQLSHIFKLVLDLTKSTSCFFFLVSLIFGLFLSAMEDLTKFMYFLSLSFHFLKTSRCCICIDPMYFLEDFALFYLLPAYCLSCGRCLLHISKSPHNLNSDKNPLCLLACVHDKHRLCMLLLLYLSVSLFSLCSDPIWTREL